MINYDDGGGGQGAVGGHSNGRQGAVGGGDHDDDGGGQGAVGGGHSNGGRDPICS